MKEVLFCLLVALLTACSSPSDPYLESVEQREYSTKMEFGELVKDSLSYHYKEVFNPKGHLSSCITIFGYDMELGKSVVLNDTIHYTSEEKKTYIDYFVDGLLSEKEVRKGNYLYVYDAADPSQPMLVRQFDKKGNMILEANIAPESIILREFEIKDYDENGYAQRCISHWKEVLVDENSDLNTFSIKGLKTLDSSTFITEFTYSVKP